MSPLDALLLLPVRCLAAATRELATPGAAASASTSIAAEGGCETAVECAAALCVAVVAGGLLPLLRYVRESCGISRPSATSARPLPTALVLLSSPGPSPCSPLPPSRTAPSMRPRLDGDWFASRTTPQLSQPACSTSVWCPQAKHCHSNSDWTLVLRGRAAPQLSQETPRAEWPQLAHSQRSSPRR